MKGALLVELFVLLFVGAVYLFMRSHKHKNVFRKMSILFMGVLLFEIMSEPMWLNTGFDSWAYIYRDITWVLTLGWVGIFMSAMLLVDYAFPYALETKRFWLYLFVIEAITVPLETLLIESGLRGYAPVLTQTMTGLQIPFTSVPLEAVYAIPLFAALILTFYKYVNYALEAK